MNINERWEVGIPHKRSTAKLFKGIANVDYDNGDYFDWKFGGDGDNGEQLMYILDILQDRGWEFIPPGKEDNDKR